MPKPVIVSAVRTAIGTSFKGSLVNTPPKVRAPTILQEAVRRAGVETADIDDVIFAESHYGGGDLARYAAAASGMASVPGQPSTGIVRARLPLFATRRGKSAP